ncbi:MAG: rod shape-determining protein MreC [Holosporales bacterium]|jgi:rod shape-determining protein MreC|nr:rod shape-determining protein MreC [Holosporales bacterium]
MFNFILSFLGLRISGFKRQNSFLMFVTKIRQSKFLRNSTTYFFAVLFSLSIFLGSYYEIKLIKNFSEKLSGLCIPTKLFANYLVEFPTTISEYISKNESLKNKIESLKIENNKLKTMLVNVKSFEQEVNEMRKFLDLKYSISNYKVTEKVLGFDKGIYESFILISVTHDNVKEGSVVVSSDALVGIVHDVQQQNNVARVRHICDQKINIPVRSQSGEHLILSGDGKNKMVSKEIKKQFANTQSFLNKTEILFTSGEGGVFQNGIPVATVDGYSNSVIQATPITNLDDLSFVWIIDPVITN